MRVLVLNPGGNSLKVEAVECHAGEPAHAWRKLASPILEGIGKEPCLSVQDGKKVVQTQTVSAKDWKEAAVSVFDWLEREKDLTAKKIDCVGLRVVHGGDCFTKATEIDSGVEEQIRSLERLAPLHNKSSIELLDPVRANFVNVPLLAVFDTAFHVGMPEVARRYAIPDGLTKKHGIRRLDSTGRHIAT